MYNSAKIIINAFIGTHKSFGSLQPSDTSVLTHGSLLSVVEKDLIQDFTVLCPRYDLSRSGTQPRPHTPMTSEADAPYLDAPPAAAGL